MRNLRKAIQSQRSIALTIVVLFASVPSLWAQCNYSEGQFLFTTSWGESVYAHYYNGSLFAAYQDGSSFKPQHWLVATGQMSSSIASCFAEEDPHTSTNPPIGNCPYSEGQYLFTTSWGEAIYAHYYNNILFAALQSGDGFKPQSWLIATGQMTASVASCFAVNDPHTTTNPPVNPPNCSYSEGQALFTTSWGEAMYAHYYNGVLYAAYQDNSNFRPQHWLVATGQMDAATANCFAEDDPHTTTTPQPDISIPKPILPNLPLAESHFAGQLEEVNCNHIKGWILNFDTPNQPTTYDIYINGQLASANVVANVSRPDIASRYHLSGTNVLGFNILIPDKFRVGVTLEVLVKYAGTSTNIAGCPLTTPSCQNGPSLSDNSPCGIERIFPGGDQALSSRITRTGTPSIELGGQSESRRKLLTSKLIAVRKNDLVSLDAFAFIMPEQKSAFIPQLITAGTGALFLAGDLSSPTPVLTDQNRSSYNTPFIGIGTAITLPFFKSLFANSETKGSIELAFYNSQGKFLHRQQIQVEKRKGGFWQPLHIDEHILEDGYVTIQLKNNGKKNIWFNDLNYQVVKSFTKEVEIKHVGSSKLLKSTNDFNVNVSTDPMSVFSSNDCPGNGGTWLNIDVTVRAPRYPVIVTIGVPENSTSDQPNPTQSTPQPSGGNGTSLSNSTSTSAIVVKRVNRDPINEGNDYRLYPKTCEGLLYMFNKALYSNSEVAAFMTNQGLIMLPNNYAYYDQSDGKRKFSLEDAHVKRDGPDGQWYIETTTGKAYINGYIHTHPSNFDDPLQSPIGLPSEEDLDLAKNLGSSVAQYIITPYYMNYYQTSLVDNTTTLTFAKTVYNANGVACPGTQQN